MKPIPYTAIRRLIARYQQQGLNVAEICARFRLVFNKRGWGANNMYSRLSWYGLSNRRDGYFSNYQNKRRFAR